MIKNRVVNRWNDLAQEAVEVTTVNSFKRHLNRILHNQMDFFISQLPDQKKICQQEYVLYSR